MKTLLALLLSMLEVMMTKENYQLVMDAIFDAIEDKVVDTANTIDDQLVLPVVKKIREKINVPDND